MKTRDCFEADSERVLQRIRDARLGVSFHHLGDYVELHAVQLSGDQIPHVARCEGDREAETYQAARALAEMVGLHPSG